MASAKSRPDQSVCPASETRKMKFFNDSFPLTTLGICLVLLFVAIAHDLPDYVSFLILGGWLLSFSLWYRRRSGRY
jgi:hypothetical protein